MHVPIIVQLALYISVVQISYDVLNYIFICPVVARWYIVRMDVVAVKNVRHAFPYFYANEYVYIDVIH
jgi:hypothetical protein